MIFLGKFDELIHIQYLAPGKYQHENKCQLLWAFLGKGEVWAEKETFTIGNLLKVCKEPVITFKAGFLPSCAPRVCFTKILSGI